MQHLANVDARTLHASAHSLVATYVLTSVHHVYSSTFIAPDTGLTGPFRGSWRSLGFLAFAVPLLAALAALHAYARSGRGRWLHAYALLSGGVFTALVGVWEGGWNHAAKLVAFAHGLQGGYAYGPAWLLSFPAVQPPRDAFFEVTGVLTLVVGLWNAWALWRVAAAAGAALPGGARAPRAAPQVEAGPSARASARATPPSAQTASASAGAAAPTATAPGHAQRDHAKVASAVPSAPPAKYVTM
jgi:hypothetical protein